MTTIRRLAFLALLASFMAQPSCSWFQSHPVIPAVVTCSGQTIPLSLVTQVYTDVMAENWGDLVANVVPLLKDGWSDLTCILNYLSTSNPETVAHISAMRAAHVELRGGSASNDSLRGGPEAGHQAHNLTSRVQFSAPQPFAYPGESIWHAQVSCEAKCREPDAVGSPGGSCICWRGPHDARGGWVAAR